MSDIVKNKTIDCERIRLAVEQRLSLREIQFGELSVEQLEDHASRSLAIRLESSLLGREHKRTEEHHSQRNIYVPRDWWEHFKQRWFPAWAIARWPVKNTSIIVHEEDITNHYTTHVCPHLLIEPERKHVRFLSMSTEAD